jgi:hypothetical protein
MKKTMTAVERTALHDGCNAAVNAAYADYKAVVATGGSDEDQVDAWDTAIEKRDIAYAKLHAALGGQR